jgi:sulfur carrier protein
VKQIFVNGEERNVRADMNVAHLIEELGLARRRLAVELNHEIVPRSTYAQVVLQEADQIEIVQAIGGG